MDVWKEIAYAEHLMRVTLPMVKDKHVFINILNHIDSALSTGIALFLKRQKMNRRIPIYPTSRELRIEILMENFKEVIPDMATFKEFLEVMNAHRNSYNEVLKEECLIIMRNDYKLVRVEKSDLAKYVEMAKKMLKRMGV